MSTYPDRCTVRIERRTIPGETVEDVRAEIDEGMASLRERVPDFRAEVAIDLAQQPSDVATDAPIVLALSDALRAESLSVRVEGMSAWTDAALLNAAGIPAICFGPGDMGLAHAAEEFISATDIERATQVLTRLATQWCAGNGDEWRS
jgi:acetylornithine deacetylase